MREIVFITGNKTKFDLAKKVLSKIEDIYLIQKELETPEIQSIEVEDIAKYSARWAAERLHKSIVLSDAGFYIESLNGFPGPFTKYINKWLTSSDLLNLMKGKRNRKFVAKDCLAYCEPGKEPVAFVGEWRGTIAESVGKRGSYPMAEITIPEGFSGTQSEIPDEEMLNFWNKNLQIWQKFLDYLNQQS